MLLPQYYTNENFNTFRSSRYDDDDSHRPMIRFDFTPTIELKMPLPGGYQWLVTTETGGWDCKGAYDQYHDGSNYFSIDFSWRNYPDPGMVGYAETSDIPILAAADGKVVFAGKFDLPDPRAANGYYVVINHSGGNDETTGYTTRYLHLTSSLQVSQNETVQQGDLLGYMGTTGTFTNGQPSSTGIHLHFGVRYNNSGSLTVPQLTKVVMEGDILKSYQTECSVNANGVPIDWIMYYHSTNSLW